MTISSVATGLSSDASTPAASTAATGSTDSSTTTPAATAATTSVVSVPPAPTVPPAPAAPAAQPVLAAPMKLMSAVQQSPVQWSGTAAAPVAADPLIEALRAACGMSMSAAPMKGEAPTSADGGGGAPVPNGNVKLSEDGGRSITLKGENGDSLKLWGDPHVVLKRDGETENFDIGYGPGAIQLDDGTRVSWNTSDALHEIADFKIDRPGTLGDQYVDTTDDDVEKGLNTHLTDEQLTELGDKLRLYKGDHGKHLQLASEARQHEDSRGDDLD